MSSSVVSKAMRVKFKATATTPKAKALFLQHCQCWTRTTWTSEIDGCRKFDETVPHELRNLLNQTTTPPETGLNPGLLILSCQLCGLLMRTITRVKVQAKEQHHSCPFVWVELETLDEPGAGECLRWSADGK